MFTLLVMNACEESQNTENYTVCDCLYCFLISDCLNKIKLWMGKNCIQTSEETMPNGGVASALPADGS